MHLASAAVRTDRRSVGRVTSEDRLVPLVRRVTGPGRVNLIGDHTDYNRGLALPLAIDLGVTVEFTPSAGRELVFTSRAFGETVAVPLDLPGSPEHLSEIAPAWARPVGAMVALARPDSGGTVVIDSDLPMGAGLSSSAALCVALAELFGVTSDPAGVARLCQEAEQRAGVPIGAMDPLVCAGGKRGHALLIEFDSLTYEQVRLPADIDIVVVHSGLPRTVASSQYALRVAECEAAAAVIGPLGLAAPTDLAALHDPLLRRRARHVASECRRVRECAAALSEGDVVTAGTLMVESHKSLTGDFEVSVPELDALVETLVGQPGIFGARMTGAGFGGCAVALCRPGTIDPSSLATPAWRVEASDGTVAMRTGSAGDHPDPLPGPGVGPAFGPA
jgi:galactokinase